MDVMLHIFGASVIFSGIVPNGDQTNEAIW